MMHRRNVLVERLAKLSAQQLREVLSVEEALVYAQAAGFSGKRHTQAAEGHCRKEKEKRNSL